MEKQILFKYSLKDAWFEKLYVITIYNNGKVTIEDYLDDDDDVVKYDDTISKESVQKISDLITDEMMNFDEDSIEDLFVLDGTMHEIILGKNFKEKQIITDNLWAHEKHGNVNGMKLVNLVKDVKHILDSEKINTTNFKLNF